MMPPGYVLGQVAAPRPEEPEEPLYVNAKQVSVFSKNWKKKKKKLSWNESAMTIEHPFHIRLSVMTTSGPCGHFTRV